MKVFNISEDPSTEEIARILKGEFSSKYTYSFFGVDSERSIIVRKSEFVGAQISKKGNQITVHAMPPNLLLSLLDPLLAGIPNAFFQSSLKKLEMQLAVFLKNKYE